jgi:RimJ/RimL family protein N-acetyltransferase
MTGAITYLSKQINDIIMGLNKYIYCDSIETSRLISRKVTEADIEIWKTFFDDKTACAFFPTNGVFDPLARATDWITKQLDRYQSGRFGLHAIIDKNSGAFLGQCGLLLQDINQQKEVEVGYSFFPRYWGQGYATEAAGAFRDFAFENEITDDITSIIHIDNVKSQQVALRNGLTRGEQVFWLGMDVYIYRMNRHVWQQQKINSGI